MVAHHGIYFAQPEELETKKSHQPLPEDIEPKKVEPRPLVCLGYVFDKSIVYMGDVSGIPNTTWEMLEGLRPKQKAVRNGETEGGRPTAPPPSGDGLARTSLEASLTDSVLAMNLSGPPKGSNGLSNGNGNGNGGTFTPTPQLPLILVIDSLWPIKKHTSHFNFPQALLAAHRLGANMTYLLGFSHPTTHFQWEELCLSIKGMDGKREHPDEGIAKRLVEDVWADEQFTKATGEDKEGEGEGSLGQKLKKWGGRVEPAWDGLKLQISKEGWTEVETRAAMFH